MNKLLPADGQFGCELKADAAATLTGKPPHADKTIELHNMHAAELCYARVDVPGKSDVIQPGTKKSKGLLRAVNDSRDRHAAAVYGITNNLFVSVGSTTNVINIIGEDPSEFDRLRVKLMTHAKLRRHMKADGYVYEPVEGCPCAFKPTVKYEDYVNTVLKGDPTYLSNPRRFDEVMKFLQSYRVDEMPEFVPDRDLLSFGNGVLDIVEDSEQA